MTIFVSHAVDEERIPFGLLSQSVPAERGRWARLSALYRSSLRDCGWAVEDVVRPEIYQTDIARAVLGVVDGDWHLAVKPTAHLRPFHGIPNAFVFDGAYATGASTPRIPIPFDDGMRVFSQADAILCATEAAARAFREQGLKNVFDLPPSVPTPDVAMVGDPGRDADGRDVRIGTWIDRDAPPETLDHVLDALKQARLRDGRLKLVVAVPAGGSSSAIGGEIARRFGIEDDAVSIVMQDPDGSPGEAWLAQTNFTLSPDPEDVFSLPLSQAMRLGIPAIGNSGITAALLEAAGLDLDRRQAMADDTRKVADARFGATAFRARVAELERFLRGDAP